MRKLSILRNGTKLSSIEQQWRLFCQKPPKGFEKYFKPGQAKEIPKEAESAPKEAKSAESGNAPKQAPPSGSPSGSSGPKQQFGFNMNVRRNIGGDKGGPFKGNDKWLTIGAITGIGLIATLMFSEGGKEITWREFVYG